MPYEAVDFNDVLHAFETGFMRDDDIDLMAADMSIAEQSRIEGNPWYEATLRHMEMVDKFVRRQKDPAFFPAYVRHLRNNKETISTSDFSQLTANTLYWSMLPLYAQADNQWEKLVAIRDTFQDFRSIMLTRIEGGDSPFPQVPELSDYPMVSMKATDKTYKLAKYGEIVSLSWEATLNDYLGMFAKWPLFLAQAARATENKFVTSLLAGASGPNPLLFSTDGSTNGGVINKIAGASTGALNEANLITAYVNMTNQINASGNPLALKPRYIVVPPALKFPLQKLLNAAVFVPGQMPTSGTAGANVPFSQVNVLSGMGLEPVEDRWLTNVDTSGNVNVTWYLVAEPGVDAAMEVGFLSGYRNPQVFQKVSGAQTQGGGASDPAQGDFEHDAMAWKIRHVLGGADLEPRYAYAMVGA